MLLYACSSNIRWTELFTKNVYPQRGNALFLNIITIADAHETVKLYELFYDLKVQITQTLTSCMLTIT